MTPGGSSIVHIYTQTVHRIERTEHISQLKKRKFGKCGTCPVFASYALAFTLQLRKKHGKTSDRVVEWIGYDGWVKEWTPYQSRRSSTAGTKCYNEVNTIYQYGSNIIYKASSLFCWDTTPRQWATGARLFGTGWWIPSRTVECLMKNAGTIQYGEHIGTSAKVYELP
jgi:hypothetical protein